MKNRFSVVVGVSLFTIFAFGSNAPARIQVEYIINFVSDAHWTLVATRELKVCLPNGCKEDTLTGQGPVCPANRVCEIVEVKEYVQQGRGYYKYTISNRLTNNQTDVPLHDQPIVFDDVKSIDEARDGALDLIRLYILCHDQAHHAATENGAGTNCECK